MVDFESLDFYIKNERAVLEPIDGMILDGNVSVRSIHNKGMSSKELEV